jgi:hypothetical protein
MTDEKIAKLKPPAKKKKYFGHKPKSKTKKPKAADKTQSVPAPKQAPEKISKQKHTQHKKKQPSKSAKQVEKKQIKKGTLKIIPLGGLDEIGKNLTAVEYGDDIIMIDCGMAFPDADMPGVDQVIPDFTYLFKNSLKHRHVEVYNRAELNEKSHRNCCRLSALNVTVIHNILNYVVCITLTAICEHLIELKVLTKYSVVEAEIERLNRLGLGVEPENDLRLIELQEKLRSHVQTRG